jgi:hypothetical protein
MGYELGCECVGVGVFYYGRDAMNAGFRRENNLLYALLFIQVNANIICYMPFSLTLVLSPYSPIPLYLILPIPSHHTGEITSHSIYHTNGFQVL